MNKTRSRANKRQNITIKEVAERAGVSAMTVSRVLNKQNVVRDHTRTRVEEAIRELNYRPNILARGLAGGRSLYIGLIYENPSHGYLSEFLVGALNACRAGGHHLVLENLSNKAGELNRDRVAQRILNAGVDAVIMPPPLSDHPDVIGALDDIDLPFARVINGEQTGLGVEVAIDDVAAARDMTEYLIAAGHKRIGFIIGAEHHVAAERRLEGFRAAMKAHRLPVAKTAVVQGRFTYRSGMEAAEELLSVNPRPTAIFASNDDMAAGVIATAQRLGLQVPEDLSVVGFDDTAIATTIWPQLTTVRQPISTMAETAVDLLAAYANQPDPASAGRAQLLDVEIVERDTVAPPHDA